MRSKVPSLIFALLVLALARAPILALGPRYIALFVDGTRLSGDEVRSWGDDHARPTLNDRPLFDPARPLRWLMDTTLEPAPPPTAHVEFFGGDRLPGRVVAFRAGAGPTAASSLPHVVVEPGVKLEGPDGERRVQVRVSSRWLRKVVWKRMPADRYRPGTLTFRDGRRLAFRALRWREGAVRLLVDDSSRESIREVPFGAIAELCLPRRAAWDAYLEQLAVLSPECRTRLLRLESAGGLVVTASLTRLSTGSRGQAFHPGSWFHVVHPAWSLEPLRLRHRTIRLRLYLEPHELPLSWLEPVQAERRPVLSVGWPWQAERNVQGGPLASAGRLYGWGIGVHAHTRIEFELPACARLFRTHVGIDRVAGRGGCARARVYLEEMDAVPLFKSPLLIGSRVVMDSGWLALRSSRENVGEGRLSLVVDTAHEDRPAGADPLDIRDTLDWLEPMLVLDAEELRAEVAEVRRRVAPRDAEE